MEEPNVDNNESEEILSSALDAMVGNENAGADTDTEELAATEGSATEGASEPEDTEEVNAEGEQTPDPEDDSEDPLELTEAEYDTPILLGDQQITIGQLVEAYNNQGEPERIAKERAEIEQAKAEVEALKSESGFVQHAAVPHKLLTEYLKPKVEAGELPAEIYQGIAQVFSDAIEQGLYDPKTLEFQAQQAATERTAAQKEAELAEREQAAKTRMDLAEVVAMHKGELSDTDKKAMMDIVQSHFDKSGEVLSLQDAYKKAKTSGKLGAAPKSKQKLAERIRKKPTAVKGIDDASTLDAKLNRLLVG